MTGDRGRGQVPIQSKIEVEFIIGAELQGAEPSPASGSVMMCYCKILPQSSGQSKSHVNGTHPLCCMRSTQLNKRDQVTKKKIIGTKSII